MEWTVANILIANDNPSQMKHLKNLLKLVGFKNIFCAKDVGEADEEIASSLLTGRKIALALVDLKYGDDFARRLIDIVKNTNVVLFTGYADRAAILPFQPDAVIVKSRYSKHDLNLIEVTKYLAKHPIRVNAESPETILKEWKAYRELTGINALKAISNRIDISKEGKVEKIISITPDRRWISTVVYTWIDVPDRANIAVSSLIGCPGQCVFCMNWRNKILKNGRLAPFIRKLSTNEIVSQVYLAMRSRQVKKIINSEFATRLVINFTCEGDGLVYNLENCASAIKKLSKIRNPPVSFIFTSVGSEESLKKYLTDYIHLPEVRHYWSINSLDKEIRAQLMPGTRGESLLKIRNLLTAIADKTCRPITASWIVIKGVTDRLEDAKMIAAFFKNRPFDIKLTALISGSMKDVLDTKDEDMEAFRKKLLSCGLKNPIRIKKILGAETFSGCGNTVADDWKIDYRDR